jgi:hypothetical protein
MMNCFGPDSLVLPLAEQSSGGIHGVLGLFEFSVVDGAGLVSCYFSPTHSPSPSLAPPGERGGLHLAASMKVGTLVHHRALASKWPQSIDGLCKSISAPRQWAVKCLQPIEKPLNQFDGNAPMRTFFPPLLTRPNVAVSSLSAPAGVERVGVRGGIQGIKNKNAADNHFGNSNDDDPCVQKVLQKQERTMHVGRGLEAKKLQHMMAIAQLVATSRELAQ